jgi:hypothetical protein
MMTFFVGGAWPDDDTFCGWCIDDDTEGGAWMMMTLRVVHG